MVNGAGATQAAATLYEAFRQTEIAPDPNRLLSPDTFRHDFMTSMQRVASFAVEHDAPVGPDHAHTMRQIFYLDPIAPPLDPGDQLEVEATLGLRFLSLGAGLVDGANRSLGRPVGPAENAVVQALSAVIRALLAVDAATDLSAMRSGAIIAQLAASLPTEMPTITVPDQAPEPTATPEPISAASPRPLVSVPCPARLRAGETCVAVSSATLFQEKNVARRIRYAGLSSRVPIVRGLSYRTGSYAFDRTFSPTTERVGSGTLCITDQRLIFLSNVRNLDLAYGSMLDTGTAPAEIRLSKANSGQLLFREASTYTVEAFEQMTGTPPENRIMRENWTTSDLKPKPNLSVVMGRILGVLLAIGMVIAFVWSR